MKKKNLLRSTILIIACCVLNQFADAQTCSCRNKNKTYTSAVCDPNHMISGRHYGCCVFVPCRVGENETMDIIIDNELSVYPNPVSETAIISFSVSQSKHVSLTIVDLNGRLIATLADKIFEDGDNELVLNTEEINAGIYFLRLQTENYSENKKLIVAK